MASIAFYLPTHLSNMPVKNAITGCVLKLVGLSWPLLTWGAGGRTGLPAGGEDCRRWLRRARKPASGSPLWTGARDRRDTAGSACTGAGSRNRWLAPRGLWRDARLGQCPVFALPICGKTKGYRSNSAVTGECSNLTATRLAEKDGSTHRHRRSGRARPCRTASTCRTASPPPRRGCVGVASAHGSRAT